MSQRRRQTRGWAAHAGLRLRSERAWLLVLPAAVLVLTAILCPSYATTYSSQAAMARAPMTPCSSSTGAWPAAPIPSRSPSGSWGR